MSDNTQDTEYSPETTPAFPSKKNQTQRTVYSIPETWDEIDGSAGLLFEAEITLRRDGYDSVQKRELYNALFAAAAKKLTPSDLASAFKETREERTNGSIL